VIELATADEIIEAFLRGVAEGASREFPSPKQAGKSIGRRVVTGRRSKAKKTDMVKRARKISKYQKTYGKNFKKIQGKYKKKNGSWKQDGFKRAQAEAHKMTRKELK
tara:strand:- start:164 stop:484 length:321 start_codon:yes stop_codon:yes gene_type:complete